MKEKFLSKEKKMRGCMCFAPLLGLVFVLGTANEAFALGACCQTNGAGASGYECTDAGGCTVLNVSQVSCGDDLNYQGQWQGEGSTFCPDCDCDGDLDVQEIDDCVTACVAGGGNEAACLIACNADGVPKDCTSDVPSWKCCDYDGTLNNKSDGFGCTVDTCSDPDGVHGTPVHTPDDPYCVSNHPATTCTYLACGPDQDPGSMGYDSNTGCNRFYTADQQTGVNCDDATDTECDNPDTCDGAGTCLDNYEDGGTICGNGPGFAGPCDGQDTCGGTGQEGNCIDRVEGGGDTVVCRDLGAEMGIDADCDVEEYCQGGGSTGDNLWNFNNGAGSVDCPADAHKTGSPACGARNAGGECDLPDTCSGATAGVGSGHCIDRVASAGTTCRAALNAECDTAEVCIGGLDTSDGQGNTHDPASDPTDKDCPADVVADPCTACGNASDAGCNAPDSCDGAGDCINRVDDAGAECRASTDECDPAEVCLGGTDLGDGCALEYDPANYVSCPTDVTQADGAPCNIGGALDGPCDEADSCCNGVCVDIVSNLDEVVCRAAGTLNPKYPECDIEESCGGGVPGCGFGNIASAGSKDCPTDAFESDSFNNSCDDQEVCSVDDHCDGAGGCHGGTLAHSYGTDKDCSDNLCCTNTWCEYGSGCMCSYVDSAACADLTIKLLVSTPDHPADGKNQPLAYLGSCFTVEVWARDMSAVNDGITCVFVDVEVGDTDTGLSVKGAMVSDNFPLFNDFLIDQEGLVATVINFGGCTMDVDAGAGDNCEGWVLVGTIDVTASLEVGKADLSAAQSDLDNSSLNGQGYRVAYQQCEGNDGINTACPGELYDHIATLGHVDQADLSMFAKCFKDNVFPECDDSDYNQDGVVDGTDLSFFATAYDEDICAGNIVIPCEKMGCGCRGGAVSIDVDGTVSEVDVPYATKETFESFGLPIPGKDWIGWRNQSESPRLDKARTSRKAPR